MRNYNIFLVLKHFFDKHVFLFIVGILFHKKKNKINIYIYIYIHNRRTVSAKKEKKDTQSGGGLGRCVHPGF